MPVLGVRPVFGTRRLGVLVSAETEMMRKESDKMCWGTGLGGNQTEDVLALAHKKSRHAHPKSYIIFFVRSGSSQQVMLFTTGPVLYTRTGNVPLVGNKSTSWSLAGGRSPKRDCLRLQRGVMFGSKRENIFETMRPLCQCPCIYTVSPMHEYYHDTIWILSG